jgi:hypothetical protein
VESFFFGKETNNFVLKNEKELFYLFFLRSKGGCKEQATPKCIKREQ